MDFLLLFSFSDNDPTNFVNVSKSTNSSYYKET